MKLNKNNKFFALLEVQNNGAIKIKKAQKYTKVNQHLRYWEQINARDFARTLNQTQLVTR